MEKFEGAKIVNEPTATTKKVAEKWQAQNQKRKEIVKAKRAKIDVEARRKKREEEMAGRKSNAEIAAMSEFQSWCQENGIKPTKRAASKHREEFEAWMEQVSVDSDKDMKEAA